MEDKRHNIINSFILMIMSLIAIVELNKIGEQFLFIYISFALYSYIAVYALVLLLSFMAIRNMFISIKEYNAIKEENILLAMYL